MATSPTAPSAVPDFPALSDRATYNAKAYAWAVHMDVTYGTEMLALANNTYANAVEAAASASTATTQAGLATTNGAAQVTLAEAQVTLATAQAVLTAADAVATAADRVQTGLDRTAASGNAIAADASADAAAASALAADASADAAAATAASLVGGPVISINGMTGIVTGIATGSGTATGTNTGDETLSTIKTKLDITTLSGANTGDQTSIVGITGTLAQFNTAVTDADFASLAGVESLTNKTITEIVYALTGTTPAFTATNGAVQTWTLSAASTPTDSLTTGQSIILVITPGAYSITWPSVTWSKVGGSGAAPTLYSAGKTRVVLWKEGSTLYGVHVGDTA